MSQQSTTGKWASFVSLHWYDAAIEFLFRFVAKTSEPLLAAGIVYSAADVLSKGHLGSSNAPMDTLWAISQALAIESSGGVVLVYGLQSLKERDHVKAWLYLILSALLAIAGGIMLFMQLAGWENQQADSPLMLALFALRCVVSVGYIYLCRTKAIRFRDLDHEEATAIAQPATTAPTTSAEAQEPAATQQIDYQRLAQELAPLLQAVRTTIIEEVKASITGPGREMQSIPERSSHQKQSLLLLDAGKIPERTTAERLEEAYQQLHSASDGRRISGRALAKQAHIDRQMCATWLKTAHPENLPQPEEAAMVTASQSPAQKPETAATDTANLPDREPEATVTANPPQPEETTTTTANMPDQEPETTVTTSQPVQEAKATATNNQPQPEEATTAKRPRQPATTTATRKNARPGPEDT